MYISDTHIATTQGHLVEDVRAHIPKDKTKGRFFTSNQLPLSILPL